VSSWLTAHQHKIGYLVPLTVSGKQHCKPLQKDIARVIYTASQTHHIR